MSKGAATLPCGTQVVSNPANKHDSLQTTHPGESRPMTDAAPSYMHGASGQPMIGATLGSHFDRPVARFGNRPALIVHQQGINWTWSELAQHVEAFAAGLVA